MFNFLVRYIRLFLFAGGEKVAGYDGEIRINTKIETEDARQKLIGLRNQMNTTAQKIETLSKKMKEMELK